MRIHAFSDCPANEDGYELHVRFKSRKGQRSFLGCSRRLHLILILCVLLQITVSQTSQSLTSRPSVALSGPCVMDHTPSTIPRRSPPAHGFSRVRHSPSNRSSSPRRSPLVRHILRVSPFPIKPSHHASYTLALSFVVLDLVAVLRLQFHSIARRVSIRLVNLLI